MQRTMTLLVFNQPSFLPGQQTLFSDLFEAKGKLQALVSVTLHFFTDLIIGKPCQLYWKRFLCVFLPMFQKNRAIFQVGKIIRFFKSSFLYLLVFIFQPLWFLVNVRNRKMNIAKSEVVFGSNDLCKNKKRWLISYGGSRSGSPSFLAATSRIIKSLWDRIFFFTA